ncbi:hemolysin family protein [Brachyspira innocens]|uniref:Hemolysin family protein n=1 Tax=Brachyspira innocens TaxID=13264 RepID=A0ABT8YXX6_9SPIR|nr:hemolysin family protein [Brachyspira innocens]MDO6994582.1 hemolysin family protein [Brachyspira innocens]MDO7020714.1 hemolysin family protein [Brachyspira innocens]
MEMILVYLFEILTIIILIMLSALFSGSETAYTSIDDVTLMRLVREKKIKEEDKKYWGKSSSMIPTLLVGNNIVNITASSIITVFAIRLAEALPHISTNLMVTISTATITVLIIIFGEILPKVLMRVNAEKMMPYLLYFMKFCHFIFKPITFLMDKITTFIMNYFVPKKLRNTEKRSALSSMDDITTIIHLGHKEGIIKEYTHELLTGVIDFRNKTVEEIMTPRVDMVCIEAETDVDEIIRLTVETGLSRFPVYEETVDHIIGIFHTRALFKEYVKGSSKKSKLKKKAIDYIMLPYFVPETKTISSLFTDMQKKKLQMVITIDEYGGTAGLVTMEDIIEEIMGDIEDESDKKEADVIRFKGKRIIINGNASIEDVNKTLKLELEHEEYQTIAGYVLDMLDHIPETNERFILKGYRGRIMKVEDRRIVEIEFTPLKYTRSSDTNENNETQDVHDIEKNDLEIVNE